MASVSGLFAAICPASAATAASSARFGHDAVDQAQFAGAAGVDQIAGQQHLHGRLAADGAGQCDHRRGAEQADIHPGRGEARGVGGHREVAGGDQLAPGGGGDAVHPGDHRLGQAHDVQHQAGAGGEGLLIRGAVGAGAYFPEVVAGAEGRAGAGQHNRFDCRGFGDGGQFLGQGVHQRQRQGVARLRTVEREPGDAVPVVAQQHGVGIDRPVGGRGVHALGPPGFLGVHVVNRLSLARRICIPRRGNGSMTGIEGEPTGRLELRMVAMPADTNPAGDIFGGWVMSLMDLAAGISARAVANGRVATAAVSNLTFLRPVKVGDVVCCYAEVRRIGRSSITLGVEAWVLRSDQEERFKVTAAEFVMVAVDAEGRPRAVRGEG